MTTSRKRKNDDKVSTEPSKKPRIDATALNGLTAPIQTNASQVENKSDINQLLSNDEIALIARFLLSSCFVPQIFWNTESSYDLYMEHDCIRQFVRKNPTSVLYYKVLTHSEFLKELLKVDEIAACFAQDETLIPNYLYTEDAERHIRRFLLNSNLFQKYFFETTNKAVYIEQLLDFYLKYEVPGCERRLGGFSPRSPYILSTVAKVLDQDPKVLHKLQGTPFNYHDDLKYVRVYQYNTVDFEAKKNHIIANRKDIFPPIAFREVDTGLWFIYGRQEDGSWKTTPIDGRVFQLPISDSNKEAKRISEGQGVALSRYVKTEAMKNELLKGHYPYQSYIDVIERILEMQIDARLFQEDDYEAIENAYGEYCNYLHKYRQYLLATLCEVASIFRKTCGTEAFDIITDILVGYLGTEKVTRKQLVQNYSTYDSSGSSPPKTIHLLLASSNDKKLKNILEQYQEPVLVRTEKGEFYIYCDPTGTQNWEMIKVTADSQTADFFASLPFKTGKLQSGNQFYIPTLKVIENVYASYMDSLKEHLPKVTPFSIFNRKTQSQTPIISQLDNDEIKTNKNNSLSQQLIQNAETFGFACQDVKRDGLCLLHAFRLQWIKQFRDEEYCPTIEELKQEIIDHIKEYGDEYKEIENKHTLLNQAVNYQSNWASTIGDIAPQVLARIYNISIAIIPSDANADPVVIKRGASQTENDMSDEVPIFYLGYETGSHYQSLTRNTKGMEPTRNIMSFISAADVDTWEPKRNSKSLSI